MQSNNAGERVSRPLIDPIRDREESYLYQNDERPVWTDDRSKQRNKRFESAEAPIRHRGLWMFAALFAHILWGLFPGFARYLQIEAVNGEGIGTWVFLASGTTVISVVIGIPLLVTIGIRGMVMDRFISYSFVALALSLAVVYAANFTLSVYVQLILLSVPFFIAFIVKMLLKKSLPKYTIPAIVFSTIGGFIVLLGDLLKDEDLSLDGDDLLGIGLALIGSIFLAIFIVFVDSVSRDISIWLVMWTLVFADAAVSVPVSFIIEEDWGQLWRMSTQDWIIWFAFTIGCFTLANILLMKTVRVLGAPFVGTLLPVRLVTAVAFGVTPLLNEPLDWDDYLGCSIVIVTLFVYLYLQYRKAKQQSVLNQKLPSVGGF